MNPPDPHTTSAGAPAPTAKPTPEQEDSHPPAPVDLAEESVAGEEDPGASLDLGIGAPPPVPKPGGKER